VESCTWDVTFRYYQKTGNNSVVEALVKVSYHLEPGSVNALKKENFRSTIQASLDLKVSNDHKWNVKY
jgi:hypothetical protein